MRGPARLATYVAGALVGAGFVLIALSWYGSATLTYLQGQFPYLVSGGMGGLALVLTGMTVLLLQTVRRESARQQAQLARLHDALRRAVAAGSRRNR
jgi:hypothetical protein